MNDARILRLRQDAIDERIDRASLDESASSIELVQLVVENTFPTAANSFFACSPLLIDGEEEEGSAASFTPDPARLFYAYNLGSAVPEPNQFVLVFSVGGRWVFRFDG